MLIIRATHPMHLQVSARAELYILGNNTPGGAVSQSSHDTARKILMIIAGNIMSDPLTSNYYDADSLNTLMSLLSDLFEQGT
eukprot:g38902.t1